VDCSRSTQGAQKTQGLLTIHMVNMSGIPELLYQGLATFYMGSMMINVVWASITERASHIMGDHCVNGFMTIPGSLLA
jgi:hypothetical protein